MIGRLFLGYVAVLAVAAWFLVGGALEEIKPAMRQSAEETLVDTANLLAELVHDDVVAGRFDGGRLAQALTQYAARDFDADIYGVRKQRASLHVYVTDARGIVLFDSQGKAVGEDYSRWNDVYLTLRGRYGARSTPADPQDETSTVMYVAAPIRRDEAIVGVLSVGKQNRAVQPFIERSERRILIGGLVTLLGTGLLAVGISFWLSRGVGQLVRYANEVGAGRRVALPRLAGPELRQLGAAIDRMRAQLEGKAYVEQYTQILTHELKSPLAAIRASAELLEDELPAADRLRFARNVDAEVGRLQQIIDRLLGLAQIESRQALQDPAPLSPCELVDSLAATHAALLAERALRLDNAIAPDCTVLAERFLLRQALDNLLLNAVEFTPAGGRIAFA
ncbi:MAG: two-component system sensor histidine kinase CreC, partial [Gammaproteobacteria bacterium]